MTLYPIPGYEGRYAITRDGRIWSEPRAIPPSGRRTPGQWLTIKPNVNGYLSAVLGRTPNGKTNTVEIHRLLAATFIGPRPEGQQVRHLDGNCLNNDIANLAYGTHSDQRYDDVRNGNRIYRKAN